MRPEIDLLRHVFAVFVIFQHMASKGRYDAGVLDELVTLNWWLSGAVIGFFMLSGALFRPPASLIVYARRQAIRLLVPFVLFSALNAVAMVGLGKTTPQAAAVKLLSFFGFGPQMYFLPYLLLVSIGYAALDRALAARARDRLDFALAGAALCLALAFPTDAATGSQPRLLFLYAAGFVFGRLATRERVAPTLAAALGVIFALGLFDARMIVFTLSGALVVAALRLTTRLPRRRLPGSGGVYLLHTPIVNYMISIALSRVGVEDWTNITLSVAFTYAFCLAVTLAFLRLRPGLGWLLLEDATRSVSGPPASGAGSSAGRRQDAASPAAPA